MSLGNKKKNYDYFQCFLEVSNIASKSAAYLNQVLLNYDAAEVLKHVETMHELENSADIKRHELCSHLVHEFMTPIEREDISLLSQELDNIIDSVEDVMRRLYMFNVKEIRHEAIEFIILIDKSCLAFSKLFEDFSNFKKSKIIHDCIVEVNTLENQGDRLHVESMRRLFSEPALNNDQMVWSIIFDSLENCLDVCEKAADIIEEIITKNT